MGFTVYQCDWDPDIYKVRNIMQMTIKVNHNSGIGVFTIGPCPPLDSGKFLYMVKNATLEKFDSQENS